MVGWGSAIYILSVVSDGSNVMQVSGFAFFECSQSSFNPYVILLHISGKGSSAKALE